MKKALWAALFLPGMLLAQPVLEKRIENGIKQSNKEKLPGSFIPVFGVFIRPQNTLLLSPPVGVNTMDIILEMKFFRYKPEFGYFRLVFGFPALPGKNANLWTGSRPNEKYKAHDFRLGFTLGGGYHLLDTRSEKKGQGHALSLMGGVLWEFFGKPTFDNSLYNALGMEVEARYQYNLNAFCAFVMGFSLGYKGIFYSQNAGNNIIDKGHGLTYGANLGFSF